MTSKPKNTPVNTITPEPVDHEKNWGFECKDNKICLPVKNKFDKPNVYKTVEDCLESCGMSSVEKNKTNSILSVVSIVLGSFVLLLAFLIGIFSKDVDKKSLNFFMGMGSFVLFVIVILLSVLSYRINDK
jgi:hypothetical protein